MKRYVLRFSKTGNMRFISHLDLQRLFKRCLKRAEIVTAYSQGFNPHELINICQPLSLGFESVSEYFEMITPEEYDTADLVKRFNTVSPAGLEFSDCKEFPLERKNLSARCFEAEYTAEIPCDPSQELHVNDFLKQDTITIIKKDKKTKKPVEKDIKHFINTAELTEKRGNTAVFRLVVRCASNETLNPSLLLESLWRFNGMQYPAAEVRITRNELYAQAEGRNISIFDTDKYPEV